MSDDSNQISGVDSIKWFHRIALPDGSYTPGVVHYGPDGGDWPTTRFGIPEDLTGKTVLDIGAWDGFFSFEAEKRGAKLVVAADCGPADGGNWGGTKGFEYARTALNSKVRYINATVDKIIEQKAPVDVVFFFGVLYHLKSPLTGLESALYLAKETCLIETAIIQANVFGNIPLLSYQPGYDGDPTNFFYPNPAWITKVCQVNGFSCDMVHLSPGRATFKATRDVPKLKVNMP